MKSGEPRVERFDQFMERALFDPQRGYYSRRIQDIGAKGDFSTSATLSPMLGRGVAAWLQEEMAIAKDVRDVIEIGAGNGALMERIRRSLGWWRERRLRWHIVETSAVLRERQKQRLNPSRLTFHETLPEALAACDGRAWIYHNELLDAFPCRRFQWNGEHWQEVWVVGHENEVTGEDLRPLEEDLTEIRSKLLWEPLENSFRQGQRIEVHQSVRDWLALWTPHWIDGTMLSIDYGDLSPAIYHRRPRGTLRGYWRHQRIEGLDIYQNVGRQDLTADINFSDYRAWTVSLGLEETWFGSQRQWMDRYQIVPRDALERALADREGAGSAFKVAVHRRNRRVC